MRKNFERVRLVLKAEGVHVWVFESDSVEGLRAGRVDGRWALGDGGGECIGSLVWCRKESHVVRLLGVGVCANGLGAWRTGSEVPPWCRFGVGAPKKKSQRGAHKTGAGGRFGTIKTGAGCAVPKAKAKSVQCAGSGVVRRSGAGAERSSEHECSALQVKGESVQRVGVEVKGKSAQRAGLAMPLVRGLGALSSSGSEWPSSSESEGAAVEKVRRRVFEDDSSEGGLVVKEGGKSGRGRAVRGPVMADAEESKVFQPAYVDLNLCQALIWNKGNGRLQCNHRPEVGSDLCTAHRRRGAPHGRVQGAIPYKKFEEFKKAALKPKESVQWYARHLMWYYASETVAKETGAVLEGLNEVDATGGWKLTDQMYEACLKKMQEFCLQRKLSSLRIRTSMVLKNNLHRFVGL